MATTIVDESRNVDWVERVPAARAPLLTRPKALWALLGLVLLAALLSSTGFAGAN